MNHARETIAWIGAGVLALIVVSIFAGVIESGTLDPPAPPGPTDGVRSPGTPISALPFTVTTSGRYYLTRNLIQTTSGITINADDVDLDLNGFTITSTSSFIVQVAAGVTGTRIHSGNLVDGQTGIFQESSASETELLIEDVRVHSASGTAILTQEKTTIRRCHVIDAGADAISVGQSSIVESCDVDNANLSGILAGANSLVSQCRVSDSGATGPQVAIGVGDDSVVELCAVSNIDGGGIAGGTGVTARNVSVHDSVAPTAVGIQLGNGGRISGCTVSSTSPSGIVTANYALVEHCAVVDSSGTGISTGARSTIRNSIVNGATADGIIAVTGALIDGNVVTGKVDGIEGSVGNRVINNVLRSNTNGIHLTGTVNHVDGNTLTLNSGNGILSDLGNSTVVRNSARGNAGGNYALVADDLQGVIITIANMLSSTLTHFNYAP